MTNYEDLTITQLIKYFLKEENNLYLTLLLIILSCSVYIRIIYIPGLLSNITNINLFIKMFFSFFLIYNIFILIYKKIEFIYISNTQKFIFKELLTNLIKKQQEEISGKCPQSVFVNIVLWAKEFSLLFVYFITILPFLVSLIFNYSFLFKKFNLIISTSFILIITLQFLIVYYMKDKLIQSGSNYNEYRNNLINFCQDLNLNIETILNYDNLRQEIDNLDSKIDTYKKKLNINFNYRFYLESSASLIMISFILLSVLSLKNISVSLLIKFVLVQLGTHTFFLNNINDLTLLLTYFGKLKDGLIDINKYSSFYKKRNNYNLNNNNINSCKKCLSLRNIEFSYKNIKNKKNNSIKIKNIDIKLGDINCLIGKIGSGKSTLLKIIFGILDIDSGHIYIDNKLFKSKNELRKNIFYIRQEPTLFNRSIIENIFYPNKEEKQKNIIFFKEIGLLDIYQELLLKKNTIGIGGENLSGGQKQIINLLRSLLSKKQIILLDEPTSSLDEKNRKIIYNMIKIMKKLNKTLIISTHDNELVNISDRIITLENGEIIDN